jgi:hypothetical protein
MFICAPAVIEPIPIRQQAPNVQPIVIIRNRIAFTSLQSLYKEHNQPSSPAHAPARKYSRAKSELTRLSQ